LISRSTGGCSWPTASLLGRLSERTRGELVRLGDDRRFPPKSLLIRHGDLGDHVVLLIEGVVKIVVDADKGGEILLGLRVSGDLIGELAALDGRARSAGVVACTTVRAKVITKTELDGFFRRNSEAAHEVRRMIIARLRSADHSRAGFVARTARGRLAGVLVEIAETYGHHEGNGSWELGVALTQAEVGSLAGMARRTSEKEFAKLRKADLVRIGYREITLLNLAGLRERAWTDEPAHRRGPRHS
jgi:CRP/FNR family cyclic AMP-dependent transcriptional regulator